VLAASFGKEGLTKGPLLQPISEFALAQHRNAKRVLLIVDEAQNLSFEALVKLRMLSNVFLDRTMAVRAFCSVNRSSARHLVAPGSSSCGSGSRLLII
jgi:hypothetical protein